MTCRTYVMHGQQTKHVVIQASLAAVLDESTEILRMTLLLVVLRSSHSSTDKSSARISLSRVVSV